MWAATNNDPAPGAEPGDGPDGAQGGALPRRARGGRERRRGNRFSLSDRRWAVRGMPD
jgi:hypothetical protein